MANKWLVTRTSPDGELLYLFIFLRLQTVRGPLDASTACRCDGTINSI
jgi:hypothetical protein